MEKIKLLLYCTKSKPYLWNNRSYKKYMEEQGIEEPSFITSNDMQTSFVADLLNGKIVAECDYEVEEIVYKHINERDDFGIKHNESWFEYKGLNIGNEDCDLSSKSRLSDDKIFDYLENKNGYAIHIKNLHIFDKPKELSEYCKRIGEDFQVLGNAPQNMMKCCEIKYMIEDYILISIRPEYLVRILNGEKTIEVRKKVLKEMMQNVL